MPRDPSKFFLLTARVKPETEQRYRQSVLLFLQWCDANRVHSGSNADLDWALLEYVHEQYELHGGDGRAAVARTLSGLQLIVPQLRGKLPLVLCPQQLVQTSPRAQTPASDLESDCGNRSSASRVGPT